MFAVPEFQEPLVWVLYIYIYKLNLTHLYFSILFLLLWTPHENGLLNHQDLKLMKQKHPPNASKRAILRPNHRLTPACTGKCMGAPPRTRDVFGLLSSASDVLRFHPWRWFPSGPTSEFFSKSGLARLGKGSVMKCQ